MSETPQKYNAIVLLMGIITASFNVVPLLLLPVACAFFILLGTIVFDFHGADVKLHYDFRVWFVLFIIYSVALAGILGVDILNPRLYRREFKFVVPFSYLVLMSSLYFPDHLGRTIKRLFVWIATGSFIWLVVALIEPSIYSKSLYPYTGYMWEPVGGSSRVYLGPFVTHSAAGGFYAVLTMLQIGFIRTEDDRRMKVMALFGILFSVVCLFYTGSRAWLLGGGIVSGALICSALLGIGKTQRRSSPLYILMLGITLLILIAGLSNAGSKIEWDRPWEGFGGKSQRFDNSNIRGRNVEVRIWLWHHAVQDFLGSPFLGVGPSRFDDEQAVVDTIPEGTESLRPVSVSESESRFLKIPFFRVNVGSLVYHTDQHAHNVYLHLLAEGGIVLSGLFVFMYSRVVKDLCRVLRNGDPDEKALCEGSLYALLCAAIASMFGNNLLSVIPMVTIFCIVAYLLRARAEIKEVFPRILEGR